MATKVVPTRPLPEVMRIDAVQGVRKAELGLYRKSGLEPETLQG